MRSEREKLAEALLNQHNVDAPPKMAGSEKGGGQPEDIGSGDGKLRSGDDRLRPVQSGNEANPSIPGPAVPPAKPKVIDVMPDGRVVSDPASILNSPQARDHFAAVVRSSGDADLREAAERACALLDGNWDGAAIFPALRSLRSALASSPATKGKQEPEITGSIPCDNCGKVYADWTVPARICARCEAAQEKEGKE